MKNVEDDSGSLTLGVNYSNFLQLHAMWQHCHYAVSVWAAKWSSSAEVTFSCLKNLYQSKFAKLDISLQSDTVNLWQEFSG